MKSVLRLYREVVAVFPLGGRRFLNLYAALLASLAIFDAAALGLLALVIAPLAAGTPVALPLLGELEPIGVIWTILAICALMVSKGVLALVVTWWATRRIPRFEVAIGDRLLRAFLSAPWRDRLRKNSNDIMRLSDSGVDITVNSFVLPGATLLGEVVSLVAVIATLAVVQPVIAVTTLLYLLLLGAVLFFWIARHARIAGEVNIENSIRTSRLILEIVAAMKEVTLRNKEPEVADVVEAARTRSARARANIYFLGQVPRYALEAGLVGGFVAIGGVGLLIGGIEQALAGVALFALAGFRVAPSVIRFQSVLSQMIAISEYPRLMLAELRDTERGKDEIAERTVRSLPEAPKRIALERVSFQYAPDAIPALDDVSLEIELGTTVAFVGASGSGKSTMVDLLLSLLEPTAGTISVDGVPLTELRTAWRARVGYVPQEVALFDATIAQNVALTWGLDYDPERVRRALEQAQLWDLVAAREGGVDARVGERGLALSGGQRQRLGIARALYSEPLVLVMDEATSALDTHTESQVTGAIRELAGGITKIVVAHRLATIMDSDRIFFMRDGKLVGSGTFEDLVSRFPDFSRQAQLAGLV
ncbi:ABC transporter ATP-binding protein [Leifsonia sp. H3M29-4]|uniref:ABC transporter ATP-binding protein n=1 Tax=Salinibacterium metalliresistens TaxID=3031321 RepID=UPI0023DA872D|nr:ABC transporter ATP-binding protein [Salinibacterium metalliresistens]MDF1479158.1 ABC transporter ATP-binding protein [Salinibacterium metalliresistens]